MKNKGFTLIELMISIAIIGIFAAVFIPVLTKNKEDSFFRNTPSANIVPDRPAGGTDCQRIGENETSFILKCPGQPDQVFKKQ